MPARPTSKESQWKSPTRRVGWAAAVLICRALFATSTRLSILGREHVPRQGKLLLAANHISHFDPPLIAIALPRPVDWLAMTELFSSGWSARLFRGLNAIPVRRGAPDLAALREAAARLEAGRCVGIFPEGGLRDREASLLAAGRPARGAAVLARLAAAPVLPAAIVGSDRLYNWRRWFPLTRAPVWIAFGQPFLAPREEEGFAATLLAALHRLRDEILAAGATAADLPQPPRQRMAEKFFSKKQAA